MRAAAAGAVVAAAVAALAMLFVQVRHPEPFLNDAVLHYGLVQSLADAPSRGQPLLDPWVRAWTLGYPVFHYYQNLPHFLVLLLAKASFGTLSLLSAFRVVEWLAVGTLPLPLFVGLRRLGFAPLTAAAGAVMAMGVRTDYLHGAELESYTWQGLGLFTQAVGLWLFPLAMAWTYRALRDGRGMPAAAWLLALTTLAHVALGYFAFVAAGVAAVLSPRRIGERLPRLVLLGVVTLAATSYLVVPVLLDGDFFSRSDLVPTWKYDSFGAGGVMSRLARGELFDFGRLPVLTALLAAGFAVLAARTVRGFRGRLEQSEGERFVLAGFVVFLLLYFGRPTWGALLDLLPLGREQHWSRALAVVQVFGCALAGAGLVAVLRPLATRTGRAGPVLAAAAALAILSPVAMERARYLDRNAGLVRESAAGLAAERDDLEAALALAGEDTDGRVYAGQGRAGGSTWGGQFLVGWVPVYDWLPLRQLDAVTYLHHMASLNSDLQASFDETNPAHYRAFNVRRVIAPAELRYGGFARELDTFGQFRVLAVDGPGFVEPVDVPYPVAFPSTNVARVHRAWLAELAPRGLHPEVRPAANGIPLLDGYDIRFPAAKLPAGPPGETLRSSRRGDDFDVTLRADRPCHAVLKMTFHPGWQALVDGQPTPTVHVLPSYVAVAVPPGEHRVEFRWRPGPLKPVLLILGVVVLGAFTWLGRSRP